MQRGGGHYPTTIIGTMNKIFALFVLLLASGALVAQEQAQSVVVNKDPRVDLLVDKQIQINEATTRDSRRFAPGFRILVISSSNRNDVIDAKTTMYREFPVVKPTLPIAELVGTLESTPYVAVIHDGIFHGLITRADVLNYLRRQMTAAD